MNAKLDASRSSAAAAPIGYIQPHALRELWFHTGTACNLECPFCLEGSKPGDRRLDRITLADAQPFIDEAVAIGVEQFSFTGGEPFIVKGFVDILKYASRFRPCLVLTNGTDPVLKRLRQIAELRSQPHPVAFRVSIDYADRARHDSGRGAGSFEKSWSAVEALLELGFKVSVARQIEKDEDAVSVAEGFRGAVRGSRAAADHDARGVSGLRLAGRTSDGADGHRALHDHVSVRGDAPRIHVRVLEDGHQERRPHARLRVHARRRRRLVRPRRHLDRNPAETRDAPPSPLL